MINVNLESMDASVFNRSDISYLKDMLLKNGELQVLPYDQLKDVPQRHIQQFCVENGYYSIPTQELIDFLKEEIGDKKAIEIGSGNGVFCKALNIKGTDNFMQLNPVIRAHYEGLRQAIVPYGEHVEQLDALSAVQKYKPETVVAAWVTHLYNAREHWRGGNEFGVDEGKMLKKVKKYILVGNEKVHGKKPILKLPHKVIKEPWILSRSQHNQNNVIYIWER